MPDSAGPTISEGDFESIGEIAADDRSRMALGRAGVAAGQLFALYKNAQGQILLVPHVSIPRSEYLRLKRAAGT